MAYFVSLYSEDGTYDRAFMKNYATLYFLDAIKRVSGVGEVAGIRCGLCDARLDDPDRPSRSSD